MNQKSSEQFELRGLLLRKSLQYSLSISVTYRYYRVLANLSFYA